MGEIFELIMVIYFGLSWPLSVYRFTRSRTAKEKNLFFEVLIWTGHVSATIDKIVTQGLTYVFCSYALNTVMVSVDICLYLRNHRPGALVSRKA